MSLIRSRAAGTATGKDISFACVDSTVDDEDFSLVSNEQTNLSMPYAGDFYATDGTEGQLRIPTNNDTWFEGDETFDILFNSETNALIADPVTTIKITNGKDKPVIFHLLGSCGKRSVLLTLP